MYVCICKAVTEQQVQAAVESGCCSPAELINALELDDPSNCGRCLDRADRLMDLPCVQRALNAPMPNSPMPNAPVLDGSILNAQASPVVHAVAPHVAA